MRRVKCSHEQPCAHCVRLGINCTYWKAARGKVSSGKRIEKLRRDQAMAAAVATSGPLQQPHGGPSTGPSAYPLGHFGSQHTSPHEYGPAHSQQPPQTQVPLAKVEETFNQTLTAVGAAAAIQYAGPSSHFPTPPSQASLSPNGMVDHVQQQQQQQHLSTPSPHHTQPPYPSHPPGPNAVPVSRPAEQAYPASSQQQQQQQQQHVPPAVHLGSNFFPANLSTTPSFRLPDLSTSLVDEFQAQPQQPLPQQGFDPINNSNPASDSRNFFDWGVGMLGTGIGAQQQQQGLNASQQQQSMGILPPDHNLYATNNNNNNSIHAAGLDASLAPSMPSVNADPTAANNARLNLADWGMGIIGQGPSASALQSPRESSTGNTSISEESRSGAASPAIVSSLTSMYSQGPHQPPILSGGPRNRAISLNEYVAARPGPGVTAATAATANDFVYGLQQQRLAQEQQKRLRAQQQRSHSPGALPFQQGLAGAPASRSSMPLPKSDSKSGAANQQVQQPLLGPAMQGVLPSTLEILNGHHPLSDYVLLPHIGLYFERLYPIMPVFSRSWMFSKLDKGDQHSDVHFAAMLLAMSSFALIQPQEAKERATARARVKKAKALLQESIRLRNAVLFGKDPTLEATMTSFYMFACLFGLGEEQAAWFRLHEAVALGTLLKMHRPDAYASLERDEAERRLRAYWLLVITERAYSLQRGHSLGFRGHPEEVTRNLRKQFGLEELADFPNLQLKLFDAVDEDFVECWNGHCGATAVRATLPGNSAMTSSSAADSSSKTGMSGQQTSPDKLGCPTFDRQRALKLWATFQQSEKEINDEVLAAEAQNASKSSKAKAAAAAKKNAAAAGAGGVEGKPAGSDGRAASLTRSEDERQAEFERHKIQLADHRITAQWLLNRLWNLCLTHGHIDLSPPTPANATDVPPPFRLDAALRIARKMLTICHELDQPAMEAHGIGLMEKLYDVAMTLVLLCRDYPALAKSIGLVDLNLKRGNNDWSGARSGEDGSGGGAGAKGAEGPKRRADGSGRGYSEHGGGLDGDAAEEVLGEEHVSYRPPALSPSVPAFLPPSTGNVPNGTKSSSNADASTIIVKREDEQDGMHFAGPSRRRSLRQAPTAIESILQEYVEIFRAFRAGDHPYLEKMVVAMKELAIQHAAGGGGSGASTSAAGDAASRTAIGQRKVAPVPTQSQHARSASATPTTKHTNVGTLGGGGGSGSGNARGANATLSAGYISPDSSTASQADRVSAMQHASAYVYTPPPTNGSSGPEGRPASSSSSSLSTLVEAASAAFPLLQQPHQPHYSHTMPMPPPHTSHVLSPGGGSSSAMSSPGFSMLSLMPTPVSAPPGMTSFHQAQLGPPSSRPFTPPSGVAPPGGGSGFVPGLGMEWSQMPEDLGWPSIEHFLRECGLWDMTDAPQQQQQQQQQQQGPGLAGDGVGMVGGGGASQQFTGQASGQGQQDQHQQEPQYSMGPPPPSQHRQQHQQQQQQQQQHHLA
ncbi:hypothetical protein OC845_001834 [Tilletia horrida]|nr:hypothetical protein OC845_001834 [Tilletia horrida]